MLDKSINQVEVSSQNQFFEILCTHAIIDRNNGRVSTPRFTVQIIVQAQQEGLPKLGSIEIGLFKNDELFADGVNLEIAKGAECSLDLSLPEAAKLANLNNEMPIAQSLQPDGVLEEDRPMQMDEERKDP